MINEENLKKLYEGILNNPELTTNQLNNYGFDSEDISTLIKQRRLAKIKEDHYSFVSVNALLRYGKKLIAMKEYDKATVCFEKCYELNPNHSNAIFRLFLSSIKNKNYDKAFEYFDHIYRYDNPNSNYYLYLLSMITELPEKHKKHVKCLKLEDIIVEVNNNREDSDIQNKIRILSLNQQFLVAEQQLNKYTKQNGKTSIQELTTEVLLSQAIVNQEKEKQNISELIKEKRYEEAIEYLENIQEQHNLSRSNEFALSLLKDLTEIIKTGIIPEKQASSSSNLYAAIKGKNYEVALQLSSEHNRKENVDENNNVIYKLLTEIKSLIDMQKKQKIESPKIEEQAAQKPIVQPNRISSSCNSAINDIIEYLLKNDLDNVFLTLRNYLDSIDQRKYEFLIVNLIKISIIEEDLYFTRPINALENVSSGNLEFNISEYIIAFYENLAKNKFDQARIYLDIISKSDNLGQPCVLTKGLEQILKNTEQSISNIKSKKETALTSLAKFGIEIDNYYGIEQTEQFLKLVSSGMTFEEVSTSLGLDEEQKSIIALVFAKISYANQDYKKGDQYIKKVERSKNKTKVVKVLTEEVKKNKVFYKNRKQAPKV